MTEIFKEADLEFDIYDRSHAGAWQQAVKRKEILELWNRNLIPGTPNCKRKQNKEQFWKCHVAQKGEDVKQLGFNVAKIDTVAEHAMHKDIFAKKMKWQPWIKVNIKKVLFVLAAKNVT